MQDQLEQELRDLITKFEADVRLAVRRNLHSMFTRAADAGADRLVHAAQEIAHAAVDPQNPRRVPPHRRGTTPRGAAVARSPAAAPVAAAPTDAAALVGRILACVGTHAGLTVAQLAPYVGIHATTLRRHLHRLGRNGWIRIEEQPSARFGGQPTRVYFASEPAGAARSQPAAACAEAA